MFLDVFQVSELYVKVREIGTVRFVYILPKSDHRRQKTKQKNDSNPLNPNFNIVDLSKIKNFEKKLIGLKF